MGGSYTDLADDDFWRTLGLGDVGATSGAAAAPRVSDVVAPDLALSPSDADRAAQEQAAARASEAAAGPLAEAGQPSVPSSSEAAGAVVLGPSRGDEAVARWGEAYVAGLLQADAQLRAEGWAAEWASELPENRGLPFDIKLERKSPGRSCRGAARGSG